MTHARGRRGARGRGGRRGELPAQRRGAEGRRAEGRGRSDPAASRRRPGAQRHHLGNNADRATAAGAGRADGPQPSIPAGSARRGPGEGSGRGRGDAGATRRRHARPRPLRRWPASPAQGPLGRGRGSAARAESPTRAGRHLGAGAERVAPLGSLCCAWSDREKGARWGNLPLESPGMFVKPLPVLGLTAPRLIGETDRVVTRVRRGRKVSDPLFPPPPR